MVAPVDIVNMVLDALGAQATVSSINPSDGTNEADVASRQYTTRIQALLRAAHWGFARKTIQLTQLKTAVGATVQFPNPTVPPPPFLYEYSYPADCLQAQFILPTVTQSVSNPPLTSNSPAVLLNTYSGSYPRFTVGNDVDVTGNNPQRVILTNAFQAVLVYTMDVSQNPNLWDPTFTDAAVATLAAWFVNPLARNSALMKDNISIAQSVIADARSRDANETQIQIDHMPDWMASRGTGDFPEDVADLSGFTNTWQSMAFPGGISF